MSQLQSIAQAHQLCDQLEHAIATGDLKAVMAMSPSLITELYLLLLESKSDEPIPVEFTSQFAEITAFKRRIERRLQLGKIGR